MKHRILTAALASYLLTNPLPTFAAPPLINYQGRIVVGTTNFNSPPNGLFKFALVNADGTASYWTNAGVTPLPMEPTLAVSLPVTKGLYSVLLGDTTLPNMIAIPTSAFTAPDLRLRVWFSDGTNGFQQLTPDQRLAPTAYLADGIVNSANIADGSIISSKVALGAITGTQIASGTLDATRLATTGSPVTGQLLSYNGTGLNWITPGGSTPTTGWALGGNGGTAATSFLGTTDNQNLILKTANVERLRLTTGGDLLLQLPAEFPTFSIRNGLGVYGLTGGFGDGRTFAGTNILGPVLYGQAGGGLGVKSSTNVETLALRWDSTGNVGIGTASPLHRLSIAGGPAWTSNGWIGSVVLADASAIAWGTNAGGQRFGMGHSAGGFYLFRTASDPGSAASVASYDFVVNDSGSVGIGTIAPGSKLDVVAQDAVRVTGFQPFMTFRDSNAGNARGRIQSVAGALTFETESFVAGTNANNYAALANDGIFSVKTLTIRGGADLAEPFEMKEEELEKGAVVVIDEDHPGRLKRSRSAYDTRVAGIVSGANGVNPGIALHQEGVMEGGQNVALSGRVYVQADASSGPIKPGDLLTTSAIPGHAMKVTDHAKAQGAVIGKAMSSLEEGTGMVLVLVTLQ